MEFSFFSNYCYFIVVTVRNDVQIADMKNLIGLSAAG
jgi:hypothetical protein